MGTIQKTILENRFEDDLKLRNSVVFLSEIRKHDPSFLENPAYKDHQDQVRKILDDPDENGTKTN